MKVLRENKRALYKFNCEYKYTAGIVLTGKDVRDIKNAAFDIQDAEVFPQGGELFLKNILLKSMPQQPQVRKLLLNRREINKILGILQNKRYHGFVVSVFISDHNLIKLVLGLGKIKRKYEKKASEKRSTEKRIMERYLREYI